MHYLQKLQTMKAREVVLFGGGNLLLVGLGAVINLGLVNGLVGWGVIGFVVSVV